jgi:hypothetical protein
VTDGVCTGVCADMGGEHGGSAGADVLTPRGREPGGFAQCECRSRVSGI